MGLSFSAIDPLYAIDYSKIINSNASSNSIKAFATSLNQMTNNNKMNTHSSVSYNILAPMCKGLNKFKTPTLEAYSLIISSIFS